MESRITAEQLLAAAWQKSALLWTVDHQIKTEKFENCTFKDRPWLKDIYDDGSTELIARKASQIGFSTMIIHRAAHLADTRGYSIIYTLPTWGDAQAFVKAKVNPIYQSQYIRSKTKDDSQSEKTIGSGSIHFRGTFASSKGMESNVGIMLSSDLNIHDESDRSDPIAIEQYESRLGASSFGGKWSFSNPTHPFTPTQKKWDISDQKHWFIKPSCGHWQYLDWFKNYINGDHYVCSTCGKIITPDDIRSGQWVKKYKNRDISGYWISHMMCPWISPLELANDFSKKTKEYFYNFRLGLPYAGLNALIDQSIFEKCIDFGENYKQKNVMGVDQGLKKHYVIGNAQGIFEIGVVDSWDDIVRLMHKYDVYTAVFDALPDLTEPRKIRKDKIGVVWLNYYKKEIKKAEYISWDEKTGTVYSDRSKMIGQVVDELIDRKIRYHIPLERLKTYIEHFKNIFKVKDKDDMGREHEYWDTANNDHYIHATILWRLALDQQPAKSAKLIEWNKNKNNSVM